MNNPDHGILSFKQIERLNEMREHRGKSVATVEEFDIVEDTLRRQMSTMAESVLTWNDKCAEQRREVEYGERAIAGGIKAIEDLQAAVHRLELGKRLQSKGAK